ncbi:hypothetical protein HY497_02005 [Candidatus Woesearchaeota archaeon]|nr:hypothetical protein [Candidatus Woesearchaeota archaeon]
MRLKSVRYADIEQYPTYFKLAQSLKEEFFGTSPAPFIGRSGYPNVNVGILAPQETAKNAWLRDAPRYWAANNFTIPQVADLRLSLINSRSKSNIRTTQKINTIAQEIGLAKNPVDVEIKLKKVPKLRPLNDYMITPMGPGAQLKSARITENPKMERHVEKAHDDTDLKANNAVVYLYKKHIDENALTRILSVGSIGIGKNRKLVPTRWSITAVDDALGKNTISEIRQYPESDIKAHFGGFMGNYFLILFFSDVWSYELFEMYAPDNFLNRSSDLKYTTDYEFYDGRTAYVENTAGGYYASRLPIVEQLKTQKRQATVLTLRFITSEYTTPLGVWVVREAVRKAMASRPIEFGSKELMLSYAVKFALKRFGINLNEIFRRSKILNAVKTQKKLSEF